MKVADILKAKGSSVQTIKPTETVGELAGRLQSAGIGAMVVSADGRSVHGIISERDVAYGLATYRGALHELPVSALMTLTVITCSPDDSLAEVAKVMTERHVRHLPVEEGETLVGIISIRDVMKHRLDEIQRKADLLRDFVISSH